MAGVLVGHELPTDMQPEALINSLEAATSRNPHSRY